MEKLNKDTLFVCTGNTCRSPMACEIYKSMKKESGAVSRGILVYESTRASQNALVVMRELKIDLSGHMSQAIDSSEIEEFDKILTMTGPQKELIQKSHPECAGKVYTLYEYAEGRHIDVKDPFGEDITQYRRCRDEIKALIKLVLEREQSED